jgi:two-component system sensor histidine kinase/response regulator
MQEFTPGEPKRFALASDNADPSDFRVLVAGDDETDRRLTIGQLGKAWSVERDMMVECAADGAEALEKIRGNRYALIVLDWNMPHQESAAVLRAMREDGLRVPVVVVSDHRREAIAPGLETMAASFVNKEKLDPSSFLNAIVASILLQEGRRWFWSGLDTIQA